MMKAVNAREVDLIAAWSVDRLGRSLTDLLGIPQGLHDKGVDLFLRGAGIGLLKIGRTLGVGTSVVQRVVSAGIVA